MSHEQLQALITACPQILTLAVALALAVTLALALTLGHNPSPSPSPSPNPSPSHNPNPNPSPYLYQEGYRPTMTMIDLWWCQSWWPTSKAISWETIIYYKRDHGWKTCKIGKLDLKLGNQRVMINMAIYLYGYGDGIDLTEYQRGGHIRDNEYGHLYGYDDTI